MDFTGSYNLLSFICEQWILLSLLTLIFVLYFHYTSTFTHFEERGVQYMKPTIFLGNLGTRVLPRSSFHHFQLDIYNYFKGQPYGGMFEGRRPILYLFDPDIIKAVCIKDFDHFVDRMSLNSNEPMFLRRNLLNLKGKEWKSVRSILTPSFSSSRLRNMLPLIEQCTNQMIDFLKKYENQDVEMKDVMGHYTLEVTGEIAFGIKCNTLSDQNKNFVKVAEQINNVPFLKRLLLFASILLAPNLLPFINVSHCDTDACEKLVKALAVTKEERKRLQIRRNDFLQLLIDEAEKEKQEAAGGKIYLDDDTMDAESLLFLFAGYETSSTLLSFSMHVLATNPDVQDKLRAHVEEMTCGKEMNYELLAEMSYLEGFLFETLRIFPPVSRFDRLCTKQYTLPGNPPVVLNPGEVVAISVYGMHMDPKLYPNPEQFRPERFMGEEKQNRPAQEYMAFGAGPRNCIGMRFVMISAKLALINIIKNFKLSACEKTIVPIPFSKTAIFLQPEKGVWVKLESLSK